MTSRFSNWAKLVVSFPLYPLMKEDRSCWQQWRWHYVPHNRKLVQGSVCASWSIEKTNICMSSEGISKTSLTCSGAHIWWNDTFVWILGQCWQGQCLRKGYEFSYEIAAARLGYPGRNIPLDRIDTHSNWAVRACAMKLAVFDDDSIRKKGKMVAVVECFLGIHPKVAIRVLSRYGNKNEQDWKIYKDVTVRKS